MNVCPHCAQAIVRNPRDGLESHCSACGASLPGDTSTELVNVARVANLAEAGFLCDQLAGYGLDARIHELEQFRALDHRWESVYLIRVPAADAAQAAAHIRQYLAEDAAEGPSSDAACGDAVDVDDTLYWRPVALVVLAGVASFVLGQQFSEHRFERRVAKESLAHAVWAIGRPFATESVPGQPRYRLSVDQQRRWVLDVDRDGDGVYERRKRYPESAVVW